MTLLPSRRLQVALAYGLLLLSAVRGDVSLRAQHGTAVPITRFYTGSDGQTHAEDLTIPMSPAAGGVSRTDIRKASGIMFVRLPSGVTLDWHTAARRQYSITLSGHGEFELAGGQKIQATSGHILLAEDTTGKGHIARTVGSEDWLMVQVPVTD